MPRSNRPLTQVLYFVEEDFGRKGREFRALDRDANSRADVVARILSGEYTDVLTVLEVDPVEHTCNDITESILAECLFKSELADVQSDRLSARFDHQHDHRKNYEAVE